MGEGPLITTQEKKNFHSARRRQWVNSSRRWIEARKNAPPKTPEERSESRRRLYASPKRQNQQPRVYA